MGISITAEGDYKKTTNWLNKMKDTQRLLALEKYGEMGVKALSEATPKRTGKTASSWGYIIEKTKNGFSITWTNSSETDSGIPIVLLLKYGHGTSTGGYVQGIDFIEPALRSVFDALSDEAWKEMIKY